MVNAESCARRVCGGKDKIRVRDAIRKSQNEGDIVYWKPYGRKGINGRDELSFLEQLLVQLCSLELRS